MLKKEGVVKDFDSWNDFKKVLNDRERNFYPHEREVWWCSLGVNIGTETDGKNDNFERPVLIMRVYNREAVLILPITTVNKEDRFHCKVRAPGKDVWVKMTQARVVDTKRLSRKVDTISHEYFQKVREQFKNDI